MIILLGLAYQIATIATTPAERVRKMHGFILMVCVLGIFILTVLASINTALSSPLVNISHYGAICAVTLSRFTGEKGVGISSQNIFFGGSETRYLKIFGAGYRKNALESIFRQ